MQPDYSRIAVCIPCHNEAAAITDVVAGFQRYLPGASVYVYDNLSTDGTAATAAASGAIVRSETRPGKGNVVRRMFADIDADIYLMADGDGTYDAASAPAMVALLRAENLDMVVGTRVSQAGHDTYRAGHVFGNWLLTYTVRLLFGRGFTDMLSGYRVFSRRFVKSFPALSCRFETETELTIHALSLSLPCGEVATPYFERAAGTVSKLSTFRDGFRILNMIALFFKDIRPFAFFGLIALLFLMAALVLGVPVVAEFLDTGLVPRLPTAVLSASLVILSALSFLCGTILDSLSRARVEAKRLAYLAQR